jgi:hypothetical protein
MDSKRIAVKRQRAWPAVRTAGKMLAGAVWLIGLAGVPGDLDTWLKVIDPEWVRFVCIVVGVPVMAFWVYPRWLDRRAARHLASQAEAETPPGPMATKADSMLKAAQAAKLREDVLKMRHQRRLREAGDLMGVPYREGEGE